MITNKLEIIIVVFRYRVQVYNVFVERGNVAVLQCGVPASVRDSVEVKIYLRFDNLQYKVYLKIHSDRE